MLELAKTIYSCMAGTPTASGGRLKSIGKHCYTLFALGEVSVESESCGRAVEDLTSCLGKGRDRLLSGMGEIDQTRCRLGVALGCRGRCGGVVKCFSGSVNTISTLLGGLKADSFSARVSEIDELERLVPEIQERIRDLEAAPGFLQREGVERVHQSR